MYPPNKSSQSRLGVWRRLLSWIQGLPVKPINTALVNPAFHITRVQGAAALGACTRPLKRNTPVRYRLSWLGFQFMMRASNPPRLCGRRTLCTHSEQSSSLFALAWPSWLIRSRSASGALDCASAHLEVNTRSNLFCPARAVGHDGDAGRRGLFSSIHFASRPSRMLLPLHPAVADDPRPPFFSSCARCCLLCAGPLLAEILVRSRNIFSSRLLLRSTKVRAPRQPGFLDGTSSASTV